MQSHVYEWRKCLLICFFFFPLIGLHEEIDRRVSQNSLGEMTKLGSKTALNRRVRDVILMVQYW